MVEVVREKALKVIKATKISIHFGLFVGFVVLSSYALENLLSGKTTFHISHEFKNLSLPSLTVCVISELNKKVLDKDLLAKKDFDYWNWAHFNLSIRHENGTLTSSKTIDKFNYYFVEHYCKIYVDLPESCFPCISLNTISNSQVENLKLVHVSQSSFDY